MNEFVRRASDASKIPALLVSRVTGFAESPEYRNLRQYELDIPGVVCGAFAQFLYRLFLAPKKAAGPQLRSALNVLEELSASSDPETVSLAATEVLENLDLSGDQVTELISISGQRTKELIDKWIRRAQP